MTLTLLLVLAGVAQGLKPDLVLHGGRVHTLEAAQPLARAVVVTDGRIAFVGSDREALALAGEGARRIDLAGRHVYPGFADAHFHLAGFAQSLVIVDLTGTRSYEEVIERVLARDREQPGTGWILGRGWDQNDWGDTRFPTHHALSRALASRPVVLTRIDGHALLANAAAMAAAGVARDSRDPSGGRILRDAEGLPTGVFVDGAMGLIHRKTPPPSRTELRAALRLAIAELHRRGITAIHDAGVDTETIELFAEMARAGEFELRNHVMIRGDRPALDRWLPGGPVADLTGDGRIAVRAIKLSADGALGSRGAALLEDYDDEPGHRGLLLQPEGYLEEVGVRALESGFQLCVHAIGDRANRLVLDAFERALERVPTAGHRFRVEHAQILHPADLPRFAELGVIPSMQAQHQTSDMDWAERRLGGTRSRGAYAWRSLLDSGVIIPGGSDCPVEEPDPFAGFRAAVARGDARGWPSGGWHPQQRMSRAEALAHLTIWPAWSAFAEDELGSIRAGKRADLVVLDRDLLTVPVAELGAMRVELTIFDGRVVHRLH